MPRVLRVKSGKEIVAAVLVGWDGDPGGGGGRDVFGITPCLSKDIEAMLSLRHICDGWDCKSRNGRSLGKILHRQHRGPSLSL